MRDLHGAEGLYPGSVRDPSDVLMALTVLPQTHQTTSVRPPLRLEQKDIT